MKPINVMVNGIPGKVAALIAGRINRDERSHTAALQPNGA